MPALDQRVAVITGAATGIGCALAGRLAGEGVRLALADLNQVGLDEVSRSLTGYGFELSTHLVDVANARQVEGFARDVVDLYGRADVLINNAGVALFGDVEEVSLADIEWLMAVNFWGVVYGIKHFLPALKQQSKAYIVNISSAFGLIAPPGQAAYAASKFAVRGLSEALRHELAGTTVQVTTVHPGGIRTAIAKAGRVGAGANPAKRDQAVATFERLATTSPERAADRIVRGMLRGKPRILIGRDALQIDLIQRFLPTRYWRLLGPLMAWRARRDDAWPCPPPGP
jgi:short-subunit dehydrogenase